MERIDPYRLQRMRDNVKEKEPNELPKEKPEAQGDEENNGSTATSNQT